MTISVVIAVHNGGNHLRVCLDHWKASALQPLEILVADDGSTDGSGALAESYGARVLPTGGRLGPARARNLAARQARGDILFFVDADVAVAPDTLDRIASSFEADPALDALMGSYDDDPADADFLSQYKNLMHSFMHQSGRREASTFWSGCGAIRRSVFEAQGGFSESYGRPAIEDIELGYRLKSAHARVLLDPQIQVKHLKRWTFWSLVKTDILDRGIPWTELILRDRNMPDDLNLQLSQRVSVALVYLLLGLAAACAFYFRGLFLAPCFAVLFFLLSRYWLDSSAQRTPSVRLAAGATLALTVGLAWLQHMLMLIPLLLLGALLLFLNHRYTLDDSKRWWRVLSEVSIAGVLLITVAIYLPRSPLVFAAGLVLAVLVVLNTQFYLFLAERRGRLFAFAVLPFHLLYHFYNGISFGIGLLRWTLSNRLTKRQRSISRSA